MKDQTMSIIGATKTDLAQLRARMADAAYAASEPVRPSEPVGVEATLAHFTYGPRPEEELLHG